MRRKRGAWEGAQQRAHVLDVLRRHRVQVNHEGGDFYMLADSDGDPTVMHIPNPVPAEIIAAIFLAFGHHGFQITDLRSSKPH